MLGRKPVDGHFLVRQSTKEKDTWIISLYNGGKYFHNKVRYGFSFLSAPNTRCNFFRFFRPSYLHFLRPLPTHLFQVTLTKEGWSASVNASKKFKGLARLVEHHMQAANGLQCR